MKMNMPILSEIKKGMNKSFQLYAILINSGFLSTYHVRQRNGVLRYLDL